jgi:hypothetical protein
MKSFTRQIKNSLEGLYSRQDQTEERLSWLEDKIDILEHADGDKEKNKVWMEHVRPLRHH